MAKGLPIVGIVCALGALLAAVVLLDAAAFLTVPVALVGAGFLFAQRNLGGIVGGVVVLGLTVVAALGLAESITTEDGGTTDLGVSRPMGSALAVAANVAVPAFAVWTRWGQLRPGWLAYVALVAAPLCAIIAVLNRDNLVDQSSILTLLAGLLAILTVASMVGLLRAGPDSAPAAAPPLPPRAPSPVRPAPSNRPPVRAAPPPAAPARPPPRPPGR